jgi:hypothetical protein
MLRNLSEARHAEQVEQAANSRADLRLQIILWSLWTAAVVATAFIRWRADVVAQRPVDLLGLVIYAALAGSIGLVVMTMLEIWLEPQRFVE